MGAGWWQPPGPPSLGDLHSICSGCWLAACRLHEQCFWMLRSSVAIKFFCEDTTTELKAWLGQRGGPFRGLLLWGVWLERAWLAPGFLEHSKSFPSLGGQDPELLPASCSCSLECLSLPFQLYHPHFKWGSAFNFTVFAKKKVSSQPLLQSGQCLVSCCLAKLLRTQHTGFFGKISVDDLFKFIESTVVLSVCTADTATGT